MKFAHLADCHIGSWRDPKLRDVNTKAFIKAIDACIEQRVDFVLIAGDLFNTPLPALDNLKAAVNKLRQLKDRGIAVYVVAGSHDFSTSGKTIIDVLEEAGLLVNVAKARVVENNLKLEFTIDSKTGAKITGMLGKKGSLEKSYYENLVLDELEQEEGYKIFVFHSALTEFKPPELQETQSQPLSLLPKNFDYYAGGHPHYIFQKQEPGYGLIAYPGPIFPNNFAELEKLERGGFYVVEAKNHHTKATWHPIQVYNIEKIFVDCTNKTPEEAEQEIKDCIKNKEFNNTIVLIRLKGILAAGKPTDINFREIYEMLYNKSAYFVIRNTNALTTREFEEVKIDVKSPADIEKSIIKEHIGKIKVKGFDAEKEFQLTKELIRVLSQEKNELTKADFEAKIREEASRVLGIERD
jgi:hypothetical protein